MFSRFLDLIRKGEGDDNDENDRQQNNNNRSNNNSADSDTNYNGKFRRAKRSGGGGDRKYEPKYASTASIEDSSSSTTAVNVDGKKRRVKEDYRIKYAYLDYANIIDMRGLHCMAEDVRSNLEILKNSYLAIVNSLVILNERRRKRRQNQLEQQQEQLQHTQQSQLTRCEIGTANQDSMSHSDVHCVSSNFINPQVAENFRNSDQNHLSKYPDTYEWNIEKFCDSTTRDAEFKNLFHEAEKYINTVERIKCHQEPINMARFGVLVRQGKSLLGIIELLNNNYSNNFLDIFRIA